MMKKRMYFNAFQMNCVVHMSPGLWVREDDHTVDYTSLAHWMKVAQLLERGIDYRPRLFRVESFNQCRRAFEIGKEGGDGLALAIAKRRFSAR